MINKIINWISNKLDRLKKQKLALLENKLYLESGGASDGLPLPSEELIYLVTDQYHIKPFFDSGELGADCIKNILKKNNLDIGNFNSVLDFGCGCGRIMRHWHNLSNVKLYGVDYNPFLLKWCQTNLKFATFKNNRLYKRLEFKNEEFDFIYAISIFTHLSEPLQYFWLDELKRVLKPGGFLLFSVHGTTHAHTLSYDELNKFASGQIVSRKPQLAGKNLCYTAHSTNYVNRLLERIELAPVDFVSGGSKDTNQDFYLIKKIN